MYAQSIHNVSIFFSYACIHNEHGIKMQVQMIDQNPYLTPMSSKGRYIKVSFRKCSVVITAEYQKFQR